MDMKELDFEQEIHERGIASKWTGSLYKDTGIERYLAVLPFPIFIGAGRGDTIAEAIQKAEMSVAYALRGRKEINKEQIYFNKKSC